MREIGRNQFSKVTVREKSIENFGLNPEHYNTHSFRIGWATRLMEKDCPETIIKKFGRWNSDIFQQYIKLNTWVA